VNTLARIIVAREALEVGDNGLAFDVLADLERDLTAPGPERRPLRCSRCPARFAWAGELEHHDRLVHQWPEDWDLWVGDTLGFDGDDAEAHDADSDLTEAQDQDREGDGWSA
jgi:hypothetical protein